MDLNNFLARDEKKDLLRFLTAGSVDDGKSTLIGRLLYDSKLIYEDQLSAVERDSKRVGHAGEDIDYALLLDGLKAEREQGITIDVAYRYFATNKRKFIIADTPGHEQYTRNMATGASTANLAVILADATKGVLTQTKRHTFITSLLGIRHIVLAVNKMDLVNFDQQIFDQIVEDYKKFIIRLNIPDVHFIPLCALKGDNVVEKSTRMAWYQGPALLKYLEDVQVTSDRNFVDMRFPIQYVNRPGNDFRGYAGTLASGILRAGDTVMALPNRKQSRVISILNADKQLDYAFPPQAITVTLADEIDISRGDMLVHLHNIPATERRFEAMLLWMDEEPMDPKKLFFIKQTTQTTKATIEIIRYRVDVNTLRQSNVNHLELNEIGRVVVTTSRPLFYDAYTKNRQTGSFILIDPITHNTSAVGMIVDRVSAETLPTKITANGPTAPRNKQSSVSLDERIEKMNQVGKTLWITGLHGSGKLALAYQLERALFEAGKTVVVLDGQSVRSGLSRELDFTPADRAEHLRRVAETARILNDHNIIVIAAFISPDRMVRRQIADIIGKDRFIEVYTDADLEHCRQHDRNNLYEKAEKGLIHFLPGMDMDFQEPESPDFHFKTVRNGLTAAVNAIIKKL